MITYPPSGSDIWMQIVDIGSSFSSFIAIFYINALFILPKFLNPVRIFSLVLSQLTLFGLFLGFHYLKYYYFLPQIDAENFGKIPLSSFTPPFIRIYIYYSLFGVGYWALYNYLEKEKRNNELEKNLLEAELSYLKYQFNPHFLYNSLSLIHSKAYPLSEELSSSVLLLAKIMRYALQGKPGERVPLVQEIQYLENFIELHRMRFSSNFFVEFLKEGKAEGKYVISLIFISLVENAFKHGQINNPDSPIIIEIKIGDDWLKFHTKNSKNKGIKDPSTGIGLANIKRRLDLLYRNNYKLKIYDEEDIFRTELIIHNIKSL
ncbi:MAG: sensor histidine kinase [Bacteroidota bacterium]